MSLQSELDGERDAGGAPLATVAEAERASAEARQQAGISEEDWERGATAGAAAPRGAKQLASLVDANLEGAAANRGGAGAGGAAEQYQQQEEGQQPSLPGCSSTSEAGGFAAPPNAAPLAEAELALAAMDSGSQLVDGAELEEQLSAEEVASRLAAAEALKAEGNELYAAGDLDAAAAKYVAALTAAPVCEAATAARAVFYSNLAAVQLKQDKCVTAGGRGGMALSEGGGRGLRACLVTTGMHRSATSTLQRASIVLLPTRMLPSSSSSCGSQWGCLEGPLTKLLLGARGLFIFGKTN